MSFIPSPSCRWLEQRKSANMSFLSLIQHRSIERTTTELFFFNVCLFLSDIINVKLRGTREREAQDKTIDQRRICTVVRKFSNLAARISSFCQVSFASICPRKMFVSLSIVFTSSKCRREKKSNKFTNSNPTTWN